MRHVVLATLLSLLSALPASAQIGPPQPRASRHGYSLGVGVYNVERTWMPNEFDIARDHVYFEGSFGFTDCVEAFGRVGISDWCINDINTYREDLERDVSTDGSPPGFVAGGLRGKMWQRGRMSIGGSVDAAWYSGMERHIRWNYNAYQELMFDPTVEINAAMTVGCDLGRSVLYGGPSLHFGYSRLDVRTHKFDANWEIEDSIHELTIRDKAGCGAFLGWRTPLGPNGWNMQLEAAGVVGGFGAGLAFYRNW